MSPKELLTASNVILDSLSDGVYVCDRDRRIVYWNKAAEHITGWPATEVLGRRCVDDVLAHVDKDGHRLCGEEFCPLHRSMVTGTPCAVGLTVYARSKAGHRIPMQVTVSPIRDDSGEIVGGVESFRDVSAVLTDLQRAKRIQASSLESCSNDDPRLRIRTHYTPQDIVGGDFYAIRRLDADHYGLLLADVMGHGVAAALHTMHLSSLWERHCELLREPATFARKINCELARVVKGDSFATGLCGVIDAEQRTLRLASAGGPPGLAMRADRRTEQLGTSGGFPLGMFDDAEFDESVARFDRGDGLLLFTDGAVEVHDAKRQELGVEGLVRILHQGAYTAEGLSIKAVEEQLLRFSNDIRLADDLTFIEVAF
jgi:PAS domain S-box-containing protein